MQNTTIVDAKIFGLPLLMIAMGTLEEQTGSGVFRNPWIDISDGNEGVFVVQDIDSSSDMFFQSKVIKR